MDILKWVVKPTIDKSKYIIFEHILSRVNNTLSSFLISKSDLFPISKTGKFFNSWYSIIIFKNWGKL